MTTLRIQGFAARGLLLAPLVAFFGAGLVAAPTYAASPAADRTEAFIAAFKKVKSSEKPTAADRKANEQAFAEIDRFMDFEALTEKPIQPRAAKFTAKQKTEFSSKFRDLIRAIAYPDSGRFFRDAKLKVGEPVEKDGATVVPIDARVPKDDLRTKLELYWAKKDGGLRLVDVAFDGDSLIQDYQNQFARIIDKDGVAGLLKKLDEKKAELDRGAQGKEARAAK
jgi:phospholipid transport system substrate-binding protein